MHAALTFIANANKLDRQTVWDSRVSRPLALEALSSDIWGLQSLRTVKERRVCSTWFFLLSIRPVLHSLEREKV